ncbi:hypothetical protein INR49_006066 [Caranx melampygus]|nr:hypothetical protein INR49_006066 [Caranx melampygus]
MFTNIKWREGCPLEKEQVYNFTTGGQPSMREKGGGWGRGEMCLLSEEMEMTRKSHTRRVLTPLCTEMKNGMPFSTCEDLRGERTEEEEEEGGNRENHN